MQKLFKNPRSAILAALLITGAAWAVGKLWGPYYIDKISPETRSLMDDQNQEMLAANNLPRLYLNVDVQKIKRGDLIRIVYPNGDIYDFETALQCSYAASNSCTYRPNPTKKTSIDQKANISVAAKVAARGDLSTACETYEQSRTFDTGYWSVTWPDTGNPNVVRTEANWVNTGTATAMIETGRGKQPFCK